MRNIFESLVDLVMTDELVGTDRNVECLLVFSLFKQSTDFVVDGDAGRVTNFDFELPFAELDFVAYLPKLFEKTDVEDISDFGACLD